MKIPYKAENISALVFYFTLFTINNKRGNDCGKFEFH